MTGLARLEDTAAAGFKFVGVCWAADHQIGETHAEYCSDEADDGEASGKYCVFKSHFLIPL